MNHTFQSTTWDLAIDSKLEAESFPQVGVVAVRVNTQPESSECLYQIHECKGRWQTGRSMSSSTQVIQSMPAKSGSQCSGMHQHCQQDKCLLRGVHWRKLNDRTCSAGERTDPAVNMLRDDRCGHHAGVVVSILVPLVREYDELFTAFGCRTRRCEMTCAE
jgi:hypothetical protein